MEEKYGTFHDAITGETVTRQLTEEEVAALTQPESSQNTPEKKP